MATLIDEGQVAELELAEGETLAKIDEDTPIEPVAQEEPVIAEPEPQQSGNTAWYWSPMLGEKLFVRGLSNLL